VGFRPDGKAWLLNWLEMNPRAIGLPVAAVLFEEL
jgi:hypothetical protein